MTASALLLLPPPLLLLPPPLLSPPTMKLNIAFPKTGCQKCLQIDDESKLQAFYGRGISDVLSGYALGEEFRGYAFKITGGSEKQGFPMKQGILTPDRVRLLLQQGSACFRGYGSRTQKQRRRKTVRGCIVSQELAVINLIIVRKGWNEIPGLTDDHVPRRRGPKRASNLRKLFKLTILDDLRPYIKAHRRTFIGKSGKECSKAPKIQSLVTENTVRRKRAIAAERKKARMKAISEAAEYKKLLSTRLKEQGKLRKELVDTKRAVKLPRTRELHDHMVDDGTGKPVTFEELMDLAFMTYGRISFVLRD